jgi:TusA-related sulfurtransferase
MSTDTATTTVDVTGQNCPMPVIKTKGAFDDLAVGDTLEVLATDSGSLSDIKGWAESTAAADLLEQAETTENGEAVYKHYVEKVA